MKTISKGIKNLFKIEKAKVLLFVLITSVLITSCSKDEPKTVVVAAVSPAATYSYTGGLADLPDATTAGVSGLFTATIDVTGDGIIGDASKVTIDLGMTHTAAGDLRIVLESPDGSSTILLVRAGANSNFIAGNIISLNSTFTALIPELGDDIPAGNYKPEAGALGGTSIGLADLVANKRILGTWKLKIYDERIRDTGTFKIFKINFAAGALK